MRPVLLIALALAVVGESGCSTMSLGLARTDYRMRRPTNPARITIAEGAALDRTSFVEIGTGVVLHDVDWDTGPDSDYEDDVREVRAMAKELAASCGGNAIIEFELSNVGAIFTVIRR